MQTADRSCRQHKRPITGRLSCNLCFTCLTPSKAAEIYVIPTFCKLHLSKSLDACAQRQALTDSLCGMLL